MKKIILIAVSTLITGCSQYKSLQKNECCIRTPDKTFTIRYGDDRFHDDSELIDEVYYVYGTDTVHVFTKQRVRNSNPTKYVKKCH